MKKPLLYIFLGILYLVILITVVYKTYLFVSTKNTPIFDDRFRQVSEKTVTCSSEKEPFPFQQAKERNQYLLDISLEGQKIMVSQTLFYGNPSKTSTTHIQLYLYAYPQFENFTISKINCPQLESHQYQGGILNLYLSSPLPEKKALPIEIVYSTNLKKTGRTSLNGKELHMANFYFQPALLQDEKYQSPIWMPFGEGYSSEMADFFVQISLPKDFQLASTGTLKKREEANQRISYSYEATALRDFVFFANPNYIVKEKIVNGITLQGFFLSENPSLHELSLNYLENALHLYEESFAPYPYSQLSMVFCTYPGAMEYSGLIMIDKNILTSLDFPRLERVIAHETSHQWWYNLVGTDQGRNPWLDESLATFSEYFYWNHFYGKDASEKYSKEVFEGYVAKFGATTSANIRDPLSAFSTEEEYRAIVYRKGALKWKSLSDRIGLDVLLDFFKKIASNYKNQIISEETFLSELKESIGKQNFDLFLRDLSH